MDELTNKTYVFDLDNTLCITLENDKGDTLYEECKPITTRINKVNELYQNGNTIIIDSARGSTSGKDYYKLTKNQLEDWGLKFHILRTGNKFSSDYYIDDKAINSDDYFN